FEEYSGAAKILWANAGLIHEERARLAAVTHRMPCRAFRTAKGNRSAFGSAKQECIRIWWNRDVCRQFVGRMQPMAHIPVTQCLLPLGQCLQFIGEQVGFGKPLCLNRRLEGVV